MSSKDPDDIDLFFLIKSPLEPLETLFTVWGSGDGSGGVEGSNKSNDNDRMGSW